MPWLSLAEPKPFFLPSHFEVSLKSNLPFGFSWVINNFCVICESRQEDNKNTFKWKMFGEGLLSNYLVFSFMHYPVKWGVSWNFEYNELFQAQVAVQFLSIVCSCNITISCFSSDIRYMRSNQWEAFHIVIWPIRGSATSLLIPQSEALSSRSDLLNV